MDSKTKIVVLHTKELIYTAVFALLCILLIVLLFVIQIACPYGFKYDYLLDIYNRAEQQSLLQTIEPHTTSLMYALGDTIYQAYGDQTNIKITTKEDLDLFEGYVLMKKYRKSENK